MQELPPQGTIPPTALQRPLALADVETLLRQHGAVIRTVDNHHWQICCGERSGLWMLGQSQPHAGGQLGAAALERLQLVLRQTGLLRESEPAAAMPSLMGSAIVWVGQEATRIYWINDRGLADGSLLSLGHWLLGEMTLHRSQRSVPYLRRIVAMLDRIERALIVSLNQEIPEALRPRPSQRARAARPPDQGNSASGAGLGPDPRLGAASPLPSSAAAELVPPGRWPASRSGPTAPASLDGTPVPMPPPSEALWLPRGARGPEAAHGSLGLLTAILEQERPDLLRRVVGVLSLETDQLDDALLFSIAKDYLLLPPGR
jgi:hypothetical protein